MLTPLILCINLLHGGYGGMLLGSYWSNLSTLNDKLTQFNIAKFDVPVFYKGGAGYGIIGRLLIGGGGGSSLLHTESANTFVKLEINSGFFELGYVHPLSEVAFIAPYMGLGSEKQTLSIGPANISWHFDSLFVTPQGVARLIADNYMVKLGLLLQYMRTFVGLQLRMEYGYSPVETVWKVEGGYEVLGAPKYHAGGLFIGLAIVFGAIGGK